MTRPKGPMESYKLNHPDMGCKYATEFLGAQSHCLINKESACPFGEECVADMLPRFRAGFIKGFSNGQAISLVVGLELGLDINKYTKIKGE